MGLRKVQILIDDDHVGVPPSPDAASNAGPNVKPSVFRNCPGSQRKGVEAGDVVLDLDGVEKDRPWYVVSAEKLENGLWEIVAFPSVTHGSKLLDPLQDALWSKLHVAWYAVNTKSPDEYKSPDKIQAFRDRFHPRNGHNHGVEVEVEPKSVDTLDHYLFMPYELKKLVTETIGKKVGHVPWQTDRDYLEQMRMSIADALQLMIDLKIHLHDFLDFLHGWKKDKPEWRRLMVRSSQERTPPPHAEPGHPDFDLDIVTELIVEYAEPSFYDRQEAIRTTREGTQGYALIPGTLFKHQSRYDVKKARPATAATASRTKTLDGDATCDEDEAEDYSDRVLGAPPTTSSTSAMPSPAIEQDITPSNILPIDTVISKTVNNLLPAGQIQDALATPQPLIIAPGNRTAAPSTLNINTRFQGINVDSSTVAQDARPTTAGAARSELKVDTRQGSAPARRRAERKDTPALDQVLDANARISKPKAPSTQVTATQRRALRNGVNGVNEML